MAASAFSRASGHVFLIACEYVCAPFYFVDVWIGCHCTWYYCVCVCACMCVCAHRCTAMRSTLRFVNLFCAKVDVKTSWSNASVSSQPAGTTFDTPRASNEVLTALSAPPSPSLTLWLIFFCCPFFAPRSRIQVYKMQESREHTRIKGSRSGLNMTYRHVVWTASCLLGNHCLFNLWHFHLCTLDGSEHNPKAGGARTCSSSKHLEARLESPRQTEPRSAFGIPLRFQMHSSPLSALTCLEKL